MSRYIMYIRSTCSASSALWRISFSFPKNQRIVLARAQGSSRYLCQGRNRRQQWFTKIKKKKSIDYKWFCCSTCSKKRHNYSTTARKRKVWLCIFFVYIEEWNFFFFHFCNFAKIKEQFFWWHCGCLCVCSLWFQCVTLKTPCLRINSDSQCCSISNLTKFNKYCLQSSIKLFRILGTEKLIKGEVRLVVEPMWWIIF